MKFKFLIKNIYLYYFFDIIRYLKINNLMYKLMQFKNFDKIFFIEFLKIAKILKKKKHHE